MVSWLYAKDSKREIILRGIIALLGNMSDNLYENWSEEDGSADATKLINQKRYEAIKELRKIQGR